MSIQQIPPRPNPTDYSSVAFLGWLDNLRNRVFQLINGVGTSTNDNAAAGSIGEYISSEILGGAAVALTNAAASDITSISLTSGDWDVWGSVYFITDVTTSVTRLGGWISTTSATAPTRPNQGARAEFELNSIISPTSGFPVGQKRISIPTTTTVYLSTLANFTVSTCSGYGYLAARRRR